MHARMRLLAVAAIAVALAGCGGKVARLVTKIERVPCPPTILEVSCPEAPEPEAGDTWDDYRDRVKAVREVCAAAVAAWKTAYRSCAEPQ